MGPKALEDVIEAMRYEIANIAKAKPTNKHNVARHERITLNKLCVYVCVFLLCVYVHYVCVFVYNYVCVCVHYVCMCVYVSTIVDRNRLKLYTGGTRTPHTRNWNVIESIKDHHNH